MKKNWKWGVILFLLLAAIGLWLTGEKFKQYRARMEADQANREALSLMKDSASVLRDSIFSEKKEDKTVLPDKAYIYGVPFICQAPHQNEESWKWHHASCEEAAVLQALYYAQGKDTIIPDEAHRIFLDMITWQEKHFGVHKDIHADSVKMLITAYFGLNEEEVIIHRQAALEDIRRFVAEGYPVIAPTYGRILRNPYYTSPGPEYHMLTVIGYTPDRIITHDVGTRRGKNFSYDNERFMKSMQHEGSDVLIIRLKNKKQQKNQPIP